MTITSELDYARDTVVVMSHAADGEILDILEFKADAEIWEELLAPADILGVEIPFVLDRGGYIKVRAARATWDAL